MGLLQRIRSWFSRAPRPERGAATLARLQVDPVFLSWAHAQGPRSLAELWRACPRADWLIELCARAGLRRPLVGAAVEACCEALEQQARMRGSLEVQQALQLGKAWVQGGGSPEPLCGALAVAVNLACDGDKDVQAARSASQVFIGRAYPEERIHAHLTELNALQRLAEAVRARLRYEELHAVIFDQPVGETPYR